MIPRPYPNRGAGDGVAWKCGLSGSTFLKEGRETCRQAFPCIVVRHRPPSKNNGEGARELEGTAKKHFLNISVPQLKPPTASRDPHKLFSGLEATVASSHRYYSAVPPRSRRELSPTISGRA